MNTSDYEEIGRECRFAIHIPTNSANDIDIHMVKEQISLKHKTTGEVIRKPNIRYIKNFERDVYITKPNYRNYKQKREYTELENVYKLRTTQSNLRDTVAKALGKAWSKDHYKKLAVSPYLYGTDISSTSLIKKMYMDKYPELISPYSICYFDIETDVLFGTEEPISASAVMGDKVFLAVTNNFVLGINNVEEKIEKAAQKYIPEYLDKHKMTIEVYVAEDTVDAIRKTMAKVHEWKPDIVAIWNMDFDIPRILETLEKYNVDPKDIFCDPSVPKHLRICKYKQGPKKLITASGKLKPIEPSEQWHSLTCTASFFVLDAMCTYRIIRLAEPKLPSYSLDAILSLKLGIRKLKFVEADGYEHLKWHQFMQKNYKIEYMVYNIFDCISMMELEDLTKDMSSTMPTFAVTTDFANFKSQPKRIADALHFYVLELGHVMGTVGATEETREDIDADAIEVEEEEEEAPQDGVVVEVKKESKVLSLKDWIITLPAANCVLGMNCIEEDTNHLTSIRAFVYDSDSVSSYPTCTSIANVSKSTTKRELIRIEGIEEDIFRMQNLNLVLGKVNAIEYSVAMFNLPKPNKLLEMFLNK